MAQLLLMVLTGEKMLKHTLSRSDAGVFIDQYRGSEIAGEMSEGIGGPF